MKLEIQEPAFCSLFVWLVAAGCCWFVLREKYWWLVWIEIDACRFL
jgi:hypothetical protein